MIHGKKADPYGKGTERQNSREEDISLLVQCWNVIICHEVILNDVFMQPADDCYIIGNEGEIYHTGGYIDGVKFVA